MKLHEEFKEYETMWEAVENSSSEQISKFTSRRIGSRRYDLTQETDLIDYIKARQRNKETRFDNHSKQVGYRHTDNTFKRERAFGILLLKQELLNQAKKLGIDGSPEVQRIKNILDTNPLTKRTETEIDRDFPRQVPYSRPRSAEDAPPSKIPFEDYDLKESIDNEYYLEVRAYDKDTVQEYDDEDNAGHTSEYGFWGTKQEIISKLNQIAETCMFSFIFVYEGDPYDNNCVFNASDVDITTDEEFDTPVIWANNFVTTEEPFMKDFIRPQTT